MRLFIGLELSASLRAEAAYAARYFESLAPGKYVPAENYHITLAFIGETAEEKLRFAVRAMEAAAGGTQPFECGFLKHACFQKPEKAILALLTEERPALLSLAEEIRCRLSENALPFDEKPFVGHTTLARGVNASKLCPLPFPFCEKQTFSRLTLFHSTRAEDRLVYLPIARADFSKL